MDKTHYQTSTGIDSIPIPSAAHYSLGFTSLGVFSTAAAVTTKNPNLGYANSYNPYHGVSHAEPNPCSYLPSNYCSPNYNNFASLRYKAQGAPPTHGYSTI